MGHMIRHTLTLRWLHKSQALRRRVTLVGGVGMVMPLFGGMIEYMASWCDVY